MVKGSAVEPARPLRRPGRFGTSLSADWPPLRPGSLVDRIHLGYVGTGHWFYGVLWGAMGFYGELNKKAKPRRRMALFASLRRGSFGLPGSRTPNRSIKSLWKITVDLCQICCSIWVMLGLPPPIPLLQDPLNHLAGLFMDIPPVASHPTYIKNKKQDGKDNINWIASANGSPN